MKQLYEYRVLNRLTQQKVASILGISQSYYSKVEAGKVVISDKIKQKIDELINI